MNKTTATPLPRITLRNWFASKDRLTRLYLCLLATYLFCHLPFFQVFRSAETLLIAVFVWMFIARKRSGEPTAPVAPMTALILMLSLLIFLIANYAWHTLTLPETIEQSTKATRYYMKPLLVLIVGYGFYLAGGKARWAMLGLSLVGLWVYLILNFETSEWTKALSGHRVDFGIHNAQHTGLIFGSAFLAMVVLLPQFLRGGLKRKPIAFVIFACLTLALTLFITIASQTRAIWIGLIAAITTGAVLLVILSSRSRSGGPTLRLTPKSYLAAGILILGTALFLASELERFGNRLDTFNTQDLRWITTPPQEGADPNTSASVRLASWRVAFEWVKERPFLGWGAGTTDDLIDQSPYFSERFKNNFGHLHNSIMESLVANGILGSLLLVAFTAWIGVASIRAYRNGSMPASVFIFAWSYFVFWLCVNQFESYILYSSGQFLNAIVVGFIYSFCISSSPQRIKL